MPVLAGRAHRQAKCPVTSAPTLYYKPYSHKCGPSVGGIREVTGSQTFIGAYMYLVIPPIPFLTPGNRSRDRLCAHRRAAYSCGRTCAAPIMAMAAPHTSAVRSFCTHILSHATLVRTRWSVLVLSAMAHKQRPSALVCAGPHWSAWSALVHNGPQAHPHMSTHIKHAFATHTEGAAELMASEGISAYLLGSQGF